MKVLLRMSILLCLYSTSSSALSRNMITEHPEKGDRRCETQQIPATECASTQKWALDIGCINQEEYNSLVKISAVPTCRGTKLHTWCPCGCFAPETRLFGVNKSSAEADWISIREILENRQDHQILTLTDDATLSDLQTIPREIRRSTSGPEKKPLVFINTSDGKALGLSEEHAILLASGEMVAAKTLKEGQELVSSLGATPTITQIERRTIPDDVLNVLTDGDTNLSHIIFAEGLVVGDLAWQNSLQSELNAIAIRQ